MTTPLDAGTRRAVAAAMPQVLMFITTLFLHNVQRWSLLGAAFTAVAIWTVVFAIVGARKAPGPSA